MLEHNCPKCNKVTSLAKDNCYRPFCSLRCMSYDLGDWATEKFKIPEQDSNVSLNSERQYNEQVNIDN